MIEQNYITTFGAEKDKRHGDGFVSFDQKTLKPNVRTQNRPLSYLFSRHEGQSIIDYLLEIVLTFFVYMLPMVIALICFVMNSNVKQKLSEKNNDTILKSVSAVLYSATGILIVAISVGCVLYTIFCVGFVFHF